MRPTDVLKRVGKVKHCGYCSWTVVVTVRFVSQMRAKKKKKMLDADALGFSGESKCNLDSRRSGQIPAIFSEKNCRIWRPFFFYYYFFLIFFFRFGCFLYSSNQPGLINAHPHPKPTRPIFLMGLVHIGSKTNLTQLVDSPTIIYQHSLYST